MHIFKKTLKIFSIGLCFFLVNSVAIASEKDKSHEKESSKLLVIEEKTGMTSGGNKTLASLFGEAVDWLKTPYRRGGMTLKGIDCSGLTGTIYKNVFGIHLQRSSKAISSDVRDLPKEDLKPGDLVFFATSRRGKGINHVGVYLGNNHFVHASCAKGVIISNLDEKYYKRTWIKGGRVKNDYAIFENLYAKQENVEIEDVVTKPYLVPDYTTSYLIDNVIPSRYSF